MNTLKCTGCGGVYVDHQADGTEYYHVCPPLAPHDVRALLAAGKTPLSPAQVAELARQDALAPPAGVLLADWHPGDAYLLNLMLPRPGARNENITVVNGQAQPIAPGAGTVTLAQTL